MITLWFDEYCSACFDMLCLFCTRVQVLKCTVFTEMQGFFKVYGQICWSLVQIYTDIILA